MTSITTPDPTEGKSFWKWFFDQPFNKAIALFYIIAMVVIYYNERGFFTSTEITASTLFVTAVILINLILSYLDYKKLKGQ